MLAQAAKDWIRSGPVVAAGPGIRHHIPFVVIGLAVIAGGMRQAKCMPHLMPDDGEILIAPGWLPGHVPDFGDPVEIQKLSAAPGEIDAGIPAGL